MEVMGTEREEDREWLFKEFFCFLSENTFEDLCPLCFFSVCHFGDRENQKDRWEQYGQYLGIT